MLWEMQDKCHTSLFWQLPHPHFSHPVPSLTVVLPLLVHVQQRQVVPLCTLTPPPPLPHTSHTPFPPSPHL